jgi:hypothetical protein
MKHARPFSTVIAGITLAAGAVAQPLPADPDVATIDGIVSATYDVISGEAGHPRDWARFRNLFAEGATLVPRAEGAPPGLRQVTPDDYITRSGPYLETNGFFEEEIGRSVHRYGDVAQVFSAYSARHRGSDPQPFIRGVNAFQLVHDGERWWILSLAWQQEHESLLIPIEMDGERAAR